jgi:geranylgeranyl diphosphate synthase type II
MTFENKIEAAVQEMFDRISFAEQPAGLYDPLRYMIRIGGKRIRPKLCLTTYSLFCDNFSSEIEEPALGLEIFHSFTLMHDDIMDRSPLRRGRETVWKKWNEDTAILSGDAMLIEAYRRIARTPQPALPKVLDLFTDTAAQVCEGQQMDMEFESRDMVEMIEYEQMIGLKTACLLACSAEVGALVAGAGKAECDALYNYGYQLGMAFQIADDYLDAFGDEKVFGKPIGGDIINCKKSWLTVRAIEKAGEKAIEKAGGKASAKASEKASETSNLLNILDSQVLTDEEKAAKIALVKKIYVELGVDKDARQAIESYSEKAMESLAGLGLSHMKEEALRRFADHLIGRVK